jgi:hypothetical protein
VMNIYKRRDSTCHTNSLYVDGFYYNVFRLMYTVPSSGN